MARRSLSEVIGAVIVLFIVVLAAVTLLRLSSQVVIYAERLSSSQLARQAQMYSPPEMSVILRNSSLYLLVSSSTPINITYAVIEGPGGVNLERLDQVVEGQSLLRLVPNYSCQNVSIFLVSSTGAVFRYLPFEDPSLMGRVPVGVDYFSCSFLNSNYSTRGPQDTLTGEGMYLGGAYYELPNGTYIVGVGGGPLSEAVAGWVEGRASMSGWACGTLNASFIVNGSRLTTTLRSSGPSVVRPMGWLLVNGVNVTVLAFSSCPNLSAGLVFLPSSGLVRFHAAVNLSGVLYLPGNASLPAVLTAEALGFAGNFSASGRASYLWPSPVQRYVTEVNETIAYNSTAFGQGSTPGPLELAAVAEFYPTPSITGRFSLSATLNITVVTYRGDENVTFSLPAPIAFTSVDPTISGNDPLLVAVLTEARAYVGYASLSLVTQEGTVRRAVGRGEFLIPFSSATLTLPIAPGLPDYVGQRASVDGTAWLAYAVNVTPFYAPLPYVVDVNSTGLGNIVFVSQVFGESPLEVGGVSESGPVAAIPVGLTLSGCAYPQLAPLSLGTAYYGVLLPYRPLSQNLTPGTYLLACSTGGGYVAIIS
ncbi:MAG: hypothetical protein ACP5HK_03265 [Acidilobus sp.]